MQTAVGTLWSRKIATRHGVLDARLLRDATGGVGLALSVGEVRGAAPLLCRVHSSCFTSEGMGGLDCDCAAQLDFAIECICREGRGVLFYLLQEGRGAGLPNKARDRSIVQKSDGEIDTYAAYASLGLVPDPRRYDVIAPLCGELGVTAPLTLMTNNPAKVDLLRAGGLEVEPVQHARKASRFNAQYLTAKAKFGHELASPDVRPSDPPRISTAAPRSDRVGAFRFAASYLVPIDFGAGPTWFRATSYVHDETGHDRMVLSYTGGVGALTEVRHVYREDLVARIAGQGVEMSRYHAALARIVRHGAGAVLAVPCDAGHLLGAPSPTEDDDLELLHGDGLARGLVSYEDVA